jgi:hypothetical protein
MSATKKSSKSGTKKSSRTKPKVYLHLREGKLKGYHLKDLSAKRRKVLVNGIKKGIYTYAELVRRLNALKILHKRTHPMYSKKLKADMEYLKKVFKKSNKKKSTTKKGVKKSKRTTKK